MVRWRSAAGSVERKACEKRPCAVRQRLGLTQLSPALRAGTAKRKPSGKSKAPRAAAPRALAVVTRSRAIKPAGEQQKQEPPPAARRSPRLQ